MRSDRERAQQAFSSIALQASGSHHLVMLLHDHVGVWPLITNAGIRKRAHFQETPYYFKILIFRRLHDELIAHVKSFPCESGWHRAPSGTARAALARSFRAATSQDLRSASAIGECSPQTRDRIL